MKNLLCNIAAVLITVTAPLLQGAVFDWSNFVGKPGGVGNVDGTGTAARFYTPRSIAVDAAGTVYVADTFNHTIRKISKTGVVTTFVGKAEFSGTADGIGSEARFNWPRGIVIGAGGVLYVADANNSSIRKITPAGVVTTFAGMTGNYGSADGTGTAARFSEPMGLTIQSDGTLYVSDIGNHNIRKITAAGVVTTVAGLAETSGSADGTGTAARFEYPEGITVDGSGTLFVADSGNCTIRKITPAGEVTTLAGQVGVYGFAEGTGTAAKFDYPTGIVVHSSGDLYVADSYNCVLRKVTQTGVVSTFVGMPLTAGSQDGTGSSARFRSCNGVALDAAGIFYIVDDENHNVRKVTPAGVVTTLAGLAPFSGTEDGTGDAARFRHPYGVAVSATGEVFIADSDNKRVRKATAGGVVTNYAGTGSWGSMNGPADTATFSSFSDVAMDAAGVVYVADRYNYVIRKIATDGEVTTFAGTVGSNGTADGMGAAARFREPAGIAIGADDIIYVADRQAGTIRKITPAGEVTTFAGTAGVTGFSDGTGAAARFSGPTDVAVDADGNVYVADYQNCCIRKITPAAVVSTLAGTHFTAGSSDGTGSAATFRNPTGVAVDPYGNVIVCDTGNHTLRRVTPAGVVTTIGGMAGLAAAADGVDTAAHFSFPNRVAIDSAGVVYVADSRNNRIMKGVPLPEIAVAEPMDTDLKDGTAITDYGQVGIHENVVKTFTVTSLGGAPLTGLTLSVTGTHAADFTVSSLSKTSLAPGYSMSFTVTHTGNVTGTRTAVLHIHSNDADEASFDIILKATAIDRPVLVTAPNSQVVQAGGGVTFSAEASHPTATVKYQWFKNGAKISGATSSTYQKTGLKVSDGGTYTVEMSVSGGFIRSSATLVVAGYVEQPHVIKAGTALKLTVSAGGPATYAWTVNNMPVAGTAATLNAATATFGTHIYRCHVSGPGGSPVLAGVFNVTVYDSKPQVLNPQNLPDGAVGAAYSHQIKINTQDRYTPTTYSATGLPRGVKVDTKTGLISGTPTVAKDYEIIVTAKNALGGSSSLKEAITITPLHTNLSGTFTGIVARHHTLNDNLGGQVNLTITSTAAISGSLVNGTKTHAFKGQVIIGGANPTASITVPRAGMLPLSLTLVFDTAGQRLTLGSRLSSGLMNTTVYGWRLKWKAVGAPATTEAKLFTFGLRPPTGIAGIPAGDGFGSFTLPASGLVSIAGKTPDGTSFTHATFVGPQGQIGIFKTLHKPLGSLHGTLDLDANDTGMLTSDVLEGSVSWNRPANAKSRYSPTGFAPIDLTAFGGWHRLPDFAPHHVLNMLLDDKAVLTFREGGLASASINPDVPAFDILLGNKPSLPAALSPGNPGSVKITSLNAKTGLFTGTFMLEDTELRTGPAFAGKKLKRTATFSGIFTQDSMGLVGVGHFLLPEMPKDAVMAEPPTPATTPATTTILSGNLLMEKKI